MRRGLPQHPDGALAERSWISVAHLGIVLRKRGGRGFIVKTEAVGDRGGKLLDERGAIEVFIVARHNGTDGYSRNVRFSVPSSY